MHKPISYVLDEQVNTVVNIVHDNTEVNTLCLTEVRESETKRMLKEYQSVCDIVCCVFDVTRPSTFTWVQNIISELEEGTKILLVGTKTDLLSSVVFEYAPD